MTAPPEQYMVGLPAISFVMGAPPFIDLTNVYAVPDINFFTVDCDTSQLCTLAMHWERTQPPANPGQLAIQGIVSDVGPTCHHVFQTPPISSPVPLRLELPQEVRYEIKLADTDTSGRRLRPYIGTLKLRQVPWNFVPVRFYNFGDTPPPPPGGDEGDWNQYAWAQYNPNGQPFPRLAWASLDLNATNGREIFPAARLFARLPQPTGSKIAVRLQAPIPDAVQNVNQVPNPLQTAVLEVYFEGTLRERWCFRVPPPGEVEPIEVLIRATAESRLIRVARLIVNPGPTPTFMGPNYWLVDTPQTSLVAPP